jgi:hypothetical protein
VDSLGNQVHPMIQALFLKGDAIFKTTVPPLTQLELLIHVLKSMKMIFVKVNFNTFPGQHNRYF